MWRFPPDPNNARRKSREAMPERATVKDSKAAVEFRYCTKLFSLEKKNCYADKNSRKEYRQNMVWPLLEEYFAWLKGVHPEKGSKLADAVRYFLNQKQQVMAFLDHRGVPISNNLAENTVRPFVIRRKNWLFCDSVKGALSSAIVYSLAETAKMNELAPYKCLRSILEELPYPERFPTHKDLEALMPWDPYILQKCSIEKTKKTSE